MSWRWRSVAGVFFPPDCSSAVTLEWRTSSAQISKAVLWPFIFSYSRTQIKLVSFREKKNPLNSTLPIPSSASRSMPWLSDAVESRPMLWPGGRRSHWYRRDVGVKDSNYVFASAFRRGVLVTINHNMSLYTGTVRRLLTDLGAFEDVWLCCPPTLA